MVHRGKGGQYLEKEKEENIWSRKIFGQCAPRTPHSPPLLKSCTLIVPRCSEVFITAHNIIKSVNMELCCDEMMKIPKMAIIIRCCCDGDNNDDNDKMTMITVMMKMTTQMLMSIGICSAALTTSQNRPPLPYTRCLDANFRHHHHHHRRHDQNRKYT